MPEFTAVNASGAREKFATGSVRDTRAGKGRYDLITPIGLKRLAQHYENGAAKYGDRNWERGQPVSRFLDSALRHLYAHLGGDRSEDHLAAAAWNCLGAIHMEQEAHNGNVPVALDDLPHGLIDPPKDRTRPEPENKAPLYICQTVLDETCAAHRTCSHAKPHPHLPYCDRTCHQFPAGPTCVPVPPENEPTQRVGTTS